MVTATADTGTSGGSSQWAAHRAGTYRASPGVRVACQHLSSRNAGHPVSSGAPQSTMDAPSAGWGDGKRVGGRQEGGGRGEEKAVGAYRGDNQCVSLPHRRPQDGAPGAARDEVDAQGGGKAGGVGEGGEPGPVKGVGGVKREFLVPPASPHQRAPHHAGHPRPGGRLGRSRPQRGVGNDASRGRPHSVGRPRLVRRRPPRQQGGVAVGSPHCQRGGNVTAFSRQDCQRAPWREAGRKGAAREAEWGARAGGDARGGGSWGRRTRNGLTVKKRCSLGWQAGGRRWGEAVCGWGWG